MIKYGLFMSPLGPISVASENDEIVMLDFCKCVETTLVDNNSFRILFDRLRNYFEGKKVEFDDIPVKMPQNHFRARVFKEVRKVKWGQLVRYKDIADSLGTSPRAVGMALSKKTLC